MEPITTSPLDIHIIITLGFYFAAAIYLIFSIILYYHWNEYSTDKAVSRITTIIYLATTVPLIIILGIMTLVI